jgi:hypothetical protein
VAPLQKIVFAELLTETNNGRVEHFLTMSAQGSVASTDLYVSSQEMRLYADAGTAVVGVAQRDAGVGQWFVNFAISGYLVDVP